MDTKLNKNQIDTPRYDLLTDELLPFKSKEFYFNSYYVNRPNLIKHFKQINSDTIKVISLNILKNRRETKQHFYEFSTVETKSCPVPMPSPALLYDLGINYKELCKESLLKDRYKYVEDISLNPICQNILIDTREKLPFHFSCKTTIKGLKFGDYQSVDGKSKIVVDRKQENDFISTLSNGWERFHRELLKAEKSDYKLVMVVESSLSVLLGFNYLPQFKWTKASPPFIFSRLREIIQNFPNFQVVFCKNKVMAANFTQLILNNEQLFDWDLQYLLDIKKI